MHVLGEGRGGERADAPLPVLFPINKAAFFASYNDRSIFNLVSNEEMQKCIKSKRHTFENLHKFVQSLTVKSIDDEQ